MSKELASVRKNLGGFYLGFRDSPRDFQFYPGIQRLFCPYWESDHHFPTNFQGKTYFWVTNSDPDFWNMTIHPRPTKGPTACGHPMCSAPPLLLGLPGF